MAMMPPEMPTMMVVVIIEERETEERQPYIGIAIVGISSIVVIIIVIIIVITGSPMTMPSLVTVIPTIPLAAVPPMHLLHKIVAQGRRCCLDPSQTGR